MFLWPDPEARASPGVTWLPALWCTDFPHSFERAHLADLSELRISEGEGNVKHLNGFNTYETMLGLGQSDYVQYTV